MVGYRIIFNLTPLCTLQVLQRSRLAGTPRHNRTQDYQGILSCQSDSTVQQLLITYKDSRTILTFTIASRFAFLFPLNLKEVEVSIYMDALVSSDSPMLEPSHVLVCAGWCEVGDHCPRHLEAAGQTVHAGGGLRGNPDYPILRYIDPTWQSGLSYFKKHKPMR